jgi:hypothetical protein
MNGSSSFGRASTIMMFTLLGAQALHWLMTPIRHPDASTVRTIAVVVQAFVGFGAVLWLTWRGRPTRSRH